MEQVLLDFESWRILALLQTILLALVLVVPPVWYLLRGETLVQPASAFSITAAGYVLGSILLLSGQQAITHDYRLTPETAPYLAFALFLALSGSAAFYLGYSLRGRSSLRRPAGSGASLRVGMDWSLGITVTILSLVGLVGYLSWVQSSGGLIFVLENIHRRSVLRTTDYSRAISQFLQVASWLWYFLDKKALRRITFWIHAVSVALVMLSFGGRAGIILHLVMFLVLTLLRTNKSIPSLFRHLRLLLGIGILAITILGIVFGVLVWRKATSLTPGQLSWDSVQVAIEETVSLERSLRVFAGQSNAASIESLSVLVAVVPRQSPYLMGASFFYLALAPIPRQWLDEKPVNLGLQLNRILSGPGVRSGTPVGWIGELYWNFGFFGVAIGCFLLGFSLGRLRRWFGNKGGAPTLAAPAYATLIVFWVPLLIKVEMKSAISRSGFYLLAFLLAHLILRSAQVKWRIVKVSSDGLPPRASGNKSLPLLEK